MPWRNLANSLKTPLFLVSRHCWYTLSTHWYVSQVHDIAWLCPIRSQLRLHFYFVFLFYFFFFFRGSTLFFRFFRRVSTDFLLPIRHTLMYLLVACFSFSFRGVIFIFLSFFLCVDVLFVYIWFVCLVCLFGLFVWFVWFVCLFGLFGLFDCLFDCLFVCFVCLFVCLFCFVFFFNSEKLLFYFFFFNFFLFDSHSEPVWRCGFFNSLWL